MDTFKSTFTALISASALIATLNLLLPDGTIKRWMQYLFSLTMTTLLLAPVVQILRMLGE